MTDKEKIKEEIERLKNKQLSIFSKGESVEICGTTLTCIGIYNQLLSFIDSLPEEPASEDFEEAFDNYYDDTWDEHGGIAMVVNNCHDIWFPSQATSDFFKAGAEWQKQKDDKHIGDLQWEAYIKGEQETKQQMMKDAVEGTVKYEIGSAEIPQCDRRYQVLSDPAPITNAKLGDKVKIIILKIE